MLLNVMNWDMNGKIPVSYTHLDVYKRQYLTYDYRLTATTVLQHNRRRPMRRNLYIVLQSVCRLCCNTVVAWKSRYDEEHGADISGFMLNRNPKQYFSEFEHTCICKTCQGYRGYNT